MEEEWHMMEPDAIERESHHGLTDSAGEVEKATTLMMSHHLMLMRLTG